MDTFPTLETALRANDGVLDTATALNFLTTSELRWKVRTGRWQQPGKSILVAQSGPLSDSQRIRVALLWAGTGAVIGGLTAARLDGLEGYDDIARTAVFAITPPRRKLRAPLPGLQVVVHYSRLLGPEDVHPTKRPRRTRTPRSLIDAAVWRPTDRGTMAVLASGVQQGLARIEELHAVVERNTRLRRRELIRAALGDIAGGAQALSELDFTRKVVLAHALPSPTRQISRRDENGRRRWLDVVWERWKVAVEIDGAQHMDALQYWDDMDRDNELEIDGYLVLRFPAWLVREAPELVAQKIRRALLRRGCELEKLVASVAIATVPTNFSPRGTRSGPGGTRSGGGGG